jgi:CheY-like chemotaxis protein
MISGNILLVDDDDDDLLIFRDALKDISFPGDCLTAGNGVEGIKILNRGKGLPAMIFLDLNMPLMNGVEFITRIKKDSGFKKIPVYIYSTSNNPADRQKLMQLGAMDFITKTADFKKLKEKLTAILNSN